MDTVQLCKPRTSSQPRSGKRFAKPRSSWPDRSALVASAFPSWDSYKDHVTGPTNGSEILTPGTFAALENDSTNWSAEAELTNALTRWARATPPEDRWWKYIVEKPSDDWTTSSEPYTKAYVPGLGLKIKYPGHVLNEQAGAIVETTFTNQAYVIEAGTDCIGFAQRAASWAGNIADWGELPQGWSETDYDNIWQVINSYGTLNRHYPSDASDIAIKSGYAPLEAYSIASKMQADPVPDGFVDLLRKVVPGDVWVKDSTSSEDTDDAKRDHIAIIAYVPPHAMELDAETLMSQIILIEGEYTNKIQSVIKNLSVGDYNHNNFLSGKQFYKDVLQYESDDPDIDLRCQSWAIRRLK